MLIANGSSRWVYHLEPTLDISPACMIYLLASWLKLIKSNPQPHSKDSVNKPREARRGSRRGLGINFNRLGNVRVSLPFLTPLCCHPLMSQVLEKNIRLYYKHIQAQSTIPSPSTYIFVHTTPPQLCPRRQGLVYRTQCSCPWRQLPAED